MTATLTPVARAATARQEARAALAVANRTLHEALRTAHQEGAKVVDLAAAAGLHPVTVHEALRGARYGTEAAPSCTTASR